MNVTVKGPVLLLIGPIGNFFSRFARYLTKNNVTVHKINFPLKEVFFARGTTVHQYSDKPEHFDEYLQHFVDKHHIKQIYMSADFYNIHQSAINVANKLGIDAYVFELGYVRPHYVTLERDRVNARSNLNKPKGFYQSLEDVAELPEPKYTVGYLWRKMYLPLCFFLQCLCRYKIIPGEHKSQPQLKFIYNQIIGTLRKPLYALTERQTKKAIRQLPHHFFVPLQVDTDSQITMSSKYSGMKQFIEEVMVSFATDAPVHANLVIKHHPADRGYNNYRTYIETLAKALKITHRVFYVHDMKLAEIFANCIGVVTVNSTVGLNALQAGLPTKVMGETFYDVEGLTTHTELKNFWHKRDEVDKKLFIKFFQYMIDTTQINGSFQGYFPFEETFHIELEKVNEPEQAYI